MVGGYVVFVVFLLAASEQQSFDYDGLNRITHVNGEERYQYDDNGNLTNKDGWNLGYNGANKPLHGVVSRSKSGQATETYTYDANGNQVRGLKGGAAWRSFSYSGRNKATEIKVGDKTTRFSYDANNQRFKRTDSQGTIFYVGNLELRQTDAYGTEQTYIKRYLGEAMQTYYADGNAMLRWLYKDHLGSVIAITNDSGKLVKRFSYDVFGLQTEIVPTEAERIAHYENTAMSALFLAEISPNTRGYTGHEPVDFEGDKRIIHMNGRMYDAALGRMLQADPVVQAPDNLQNFNAYSYVLNNPLNATDPSGYFFKNIGSFFKKYWRVIAAVVVAIVSYGYLTEPAFAWAGAMGATGTAQVVIGGAIAGGIAGAASGFVSTGTLQGALNGGLSGAVFGGLGGYFNANTVAAGNQVFLHAAAGGIMAEVQGGNFGHGFITAGVMKGVSFANSVSSGAEFGEIAAKTVIQSMVGGTVSKLTGGKFANGATTAAIQYVVNAASSAIQEMWTTKDFLKHYMTGGGKAVDLGKVGLGSEFENTSTIKETTNGFIDETMQGPVFNLSASARASTDVTNVGVTDFTGWPSLFSVGNGRLNMDASCTGGHCTFMFETNDQFIDALDIYDQWEGNQDIPFSQSFEINYKWTETRIYSQ